jgi:hypothetical protein
MLYYLPSPQPRQGIGALNAATPQKSWNDLLQDIAKSIPQAIVVTEQLVPSIKRLTPVAERISPWIPWLTAGTFFLGTALIIYTARKVTK